MKKITLFLLMLGFFGQAQRFDWVSTTGSGFGASGAIGMARDSQGNIYTLNASNEAQSCQEMTENPAGGSSMFLYKFNASGKIIYIKAFGTNFSALNLVVGENDNVYVLGALRGTGEIRINGEVITDLENRNYIFKLNPTGDLIWRTKNNVSFGNFTEASMLLFANNHIYFQSNGLSISKLNTSGDYVSTLTANDFTSTTSASAVFFRGAGVLANGDLIFSATSSGTITYGTTVLVPTENSFTHVAMLTLRTTENLGFVWANYTNALRNPDQNKIPMAIGNDEAIYFGLQITGSLTVGSDTVTNPDPGSNSTGAIMKMDADGNKVWIKSTTTNAKTYSVLNNPDGSGVFFGGLLSGFQLFDLGVTTLNPTNGNSFITKIDYSGTFKNSYSFASGPVGSYVLSMETNKTGTFYVGGKLNNTTPPVFSCIPRTPNNGLFLGKFTEEPDTAPMPSITATENILTASPVFTGTIQWFLNGSPLNGEGKQKLFATKNGDYSVSYSYVPACKATSLPLNFTAPSNLILNPSAEEPAVNDEIPHWTETKGNSWVASDNLGNFGFAEQTVPDGNHWFYPGNTVQNVDGFDVSELEQVVDISTDANAIDQSNKTYFFSCYTRSYEQVVNDQSNILIDFLDKNNQVLTTYSFGPFTTSISWNKVNEILLAPINSRKIKIRLHTVRRSGTDNNGYYDDLYLAGDSVLSVSNNTLEESNIVIYPNPSTGIFNIKTNTLIENAAITITDINGRIVHQSKADNLQNKSLDLHHLQSGIYILNIDNETFKFTQKLIKN